MKKKNLISNILFAFKEVYTQARMFFVLFIVKTSIASGKVFVFARLSQLLLDEITYAINAGVVTRKTIELSLFIVFAEMLVITITSIIEYFSTKSTLKYNNSMSVKNAEKCSALKYEFYDSPENQNNLRQFNTDAHAIINLFCQTITLTTVGISFVASLIISLKFSIVITIFALGVSLPGFFVNKKIKADGYKMEQRLNLLDRRVDYFRGIFSNKGAYQELHLFHALSYMRKILDEAMESRASERCIQYKKNLCKELCLFLFYLIANVVINLLLVVSVIAAKLSIGNYTYYNTIINNLKNNSSNLVGIFNEIIISNKKVKNYRNFYDSENEYGKGSVDFLPDSFLIEFVDVSFKYPNTERFVLKNISFTIKSGEKVALAGINGAGKTTIVNLLLRFYDPTQGVILINGQDIRAIKIEHYWKLFTAMFQHANLYNFSLRENLLISNASSDSALYDQQLQDALAKAGIMLPIDALGKQVGKSFDADGFIFSPGEAQKINVAKTLLRDSDIIILDEPSSAMDAVSEHNIINNVFDFAEEKTLIFISHKLSNLKRVDKILFLRNGTILEAGSHDELMNIENGEYKKMYTMQAEKYI